MMARDLDAQVEAFRTPTGAPAIEGRDEWIEGRPYLGLDVLARSRGLNPTDEQEDHRTRTTHRLTDISDHSVTTRVTPRPGT